VSRRAALVAARPTTKKEWLSPYLYDKPARFSTKSDDYGSDFIPVLKRKPKEQKNEDASGEHTGTNVYYAFCARKGRILIMIPHRGTGHVRLGIGRGRAGT
jgi:hypothetical protein